MYNHDMSVSFIRAMRRSHTSIITFIGLEEKQQHIPSMQKS